MIPYIKWGNKMIYQLCVLRDLIKKSYLKFFGVWLLFLLIIFSLVIVSPVGVRLSDFYFLLGVFYTYDVTFLEVLWIGFQLLSLIYMFLLFLEFEKYNSSEFLLLRCKMRCVLINKLLIFSLFITLFRLIFFGVLFLFLHNSVVFDWFCFWQNIMLYVGAIFFVFLLYLVTFLRNI